MYDEAEIVLWEDHRQRIGWLDPEIDFEEPYLVSSVGFVVEENDKYLVLTGGVNQGGNPLGSIEILKVAIVERHKFNPREITGRC